MADSLMSYAIAAGIFAFLTAVLFTTRAKHHHDAKEQTIPEHRSTEAA
jgi:hypothetical protein